MFSNLIVGQKSLYFSIRVFSHSVHSREFKHIHCVSRTWTLQINSQKKRTKLWSSQDVVESEYSSLEVFSPTLLVWCYSWAELKNVKHSLKTTKCLDSFFSFKKEMKVSSLSLLWCNISMKLMAGVGAAVFRGNLWFKTLVGPKGLRPHKSWRESVGKVDWVRLFF